MEKRKLLLLPKTERILNQLGENIRLARLRRKLSTAEVCERAGISRTTLYALEKGNSGVAMSFYAQVLMILGFENDLLKVAKDDEFGHKLQDAGLLTKERAPKKKRNNE